MLGEEGEERGMERKEEGEEEEEEAWKYIRLDYNCRACQASGAALPLRPSSPNRARTELTEPGRAARAPALVTAGFSGAGVEQCRTLDLARLNIAFCINKRVDLQQMQP
jgi:hypothetical protein